jgi:broad specificity phosphatase PhoE
MTDLYIFRHGNTVNSNNLFIKFFGIWRKDSHSLVTLPKALPALKRIGEYLKNIKTNADFTSPYIRCVDSARVVSEVTGKTYQEDERVRELEARGESFESLKSRVGNFLAEIADKNYSAVSICTHGAVIATIKHLATGRSFPHFKIFDYPNPGNLVTIKNGKIETINFN